MVAMSWLFAYAYSIAFIAGEVKRPDKSIIWANTFAILVPFVFMLWIAIVLYKTVGFQFLNATAWNDNWNSTTGNSLASMAGMPHGTNFIDLAVYSLGSSATWAKILAGFMGLSYVAFTVWWLALSYLAFPRILFAWGMDRMGPKWFTDINPRFASPVKNHILCLVLGQALLILYYTLLANTMQNIVLTGMQVTSVFIPTAIAALYFPYSKRAKGVWDSSPYKKWTFLGLPVVVWGAGGRPRVPRHPALLLHLQCGGQAVHRSVGDPLRRRLGARHHLVLRLERLQQVQVRHGHLGCDLRRAASGVT